MGKDIGGWARKTKEKLRARRRFLLDFPAIDQESNVMPVTLVNKVVATYRFDINLRFSRENNSALSEGEKFGKASRHERERRENARQINARSCGNLETCRNYKRIPMPVETIDKHVLVVRLLEFSFHPSDFSAGNGQTFARESIATVNRASREGARGDLRENRRI